jgi:hypothetical protein
MSIVQQASGAFTGTSFTPTLPGASDSANCVVIIVAANTTVTTPTNWTLRTSQVNLMGHYLYDRAGVSLTSVAMSNASGQGTWWIAEIASGAHDISSSANAGSGNSTTYNTPTLTPTAGTRLVIASLGSTITGGAARTISGWTNSFVEQADVCQPTVDGPMQGVALLDDFTANGSTGYSTTGTYSTSSNGRTAIITAYVTAGGAPALPPIIVMPPRRP